MPTPSVGDAPTPDSGMQAGTKTRPRATPGKKPLARLLDGAIRYSHVLSALLVAAGVLGFAALPAAMRKTHFDENALLAGSARPTLRSHTPDAVTLGASLAAAVAASRPSPACAATLAAALADTLGLEAYSSSFTAPWPYGGWAGLNCTNVHAILRAPRGDGKEALLLVTPLQMQEAVRDFAQPPAAAAAALTAAAALMVHLGCVPWLSKDVVWVLPDASCGLVDSMEAWVAAYQLPAEGGTARPFGRAGVMQQALVVQVEAWPFTIAEVLVMGADGQLPKLDMFWLVRYYLSAWARSVPVLLQHDAALAPLVSRALARLEAALPRGALPAPAAAYASWVASVAAFAATQARGLPAGAHAAFKRHNADAVTLRLAAPPGGARPPVDAHVALGALLDVCELVLRSCSVLIEKFHHSFFLYLQVGTEHFVTVEVYIGLPAALIAALLLRAAATQQEASGCPGSTAGTWASSARLVSGVYAWCAACGWLLRAAVAAACCGGGAAAAARRLAGDAPVVAAAVAAALGGAWEVARGLRAAAAPRAARPASNGKAVVQLGGRGAAAAPGWRQVKVWMLSVAAVQLAAMSCINWALAYATCLAVIPLSTCRSWREAAPAAMQASGGAGGPAVQARRRALGTLASAVAVAVVNPAVVLCVAWLAAGHPLAALPGAWRWLLLETRPVTYLFWWGVYVPFWVVALLIGSLVP